MRSRENVFTAEQIEAYERMGIAIAIYQLIENKIETILVSDGLCEMLGKNRDSLIQHFNEDMFGNVHPEDVEMLAQIGYRFSRDGGSYDVTYRIKLYGKEEYRLVHTIGKIQTVGSGARVAFLNYADVTDLKKNELYNSKEINDPKVNFFYENMGPMIVVAQKELRLLYYNQAACRILSPKSNFDSGITFQQFFFPDFPEGMKGLIDAVNGGTRVVEEPYTHRELEISVIASSWNKERAYVIYLYEIASDNSDIAAETTLRHRRIAFHNVMFAGKQDGFSQTENRYQNFHIWNLTRDEIVYCKKPMEMAYRSKNRLAFDNYLTNLSAQCMDAEDKEFLKHCRREELLSMSLSASYPESRMLHLNTDHGIMYVLFELIMMQSPDTGEVYIKVWEENITDKEIISILAKRAVEEEYDFMAYLDVLADRCWIIYGRVSGKKRCIKISDHSQAEEFLHILEEIFDKNFDNVEEMIHYIRRNCDKENAFVMLRQRPDGKIKRLHVQQEGTNSNIFYLSCTDLTQVLLKEKERERELEAAKNEALRANQHLKESVLNEREKVEAILVQTVLAINKALDAKDPYTCQHSERVAKYASEIARRLHWNKKQVNDIYNISMVHDIGKIGIPDHLLMKPAALAKEEYEMIKDHVVVGSNILKDFSAIKNVYEGILYHHERYDGEGYIFGLKGDKIPIEARIIGIADAVDAMYSTRPYREKQNVEFIIEELRAGRGRQFDPDLVDIMLELIQGGLLETDNNRMTIT